MAIINRSKPYKKENLEKLHAAQLAILKDFHEFCMANKIRYFAVYGTAIGAVRHHGFIPWDDDIDVGMLREDYDRFLSLSHKLASKYRIMTPLKNKEYSCTVTHLQNKNTLFVSEELKHQPFPMCIDLDIFPFDRVAPEGRSGIRQQKKATMLGRVLFLIGTAHPYVATQGIKGWIQRTVCTMGHGVLKLFHISPSYVYKKYLKVATQYNQTESPFVTSFEYAGGMKDKIRAKDLFPLEKVMFEDVEIMLPHNNHAFLTKVYGDYMEIPPKEMQINHSPFLLKFEGGKVLRQDRGDI